jgi:hypothetical protein
LTASAIRHQWQAFARNCKLVELICEIRSVSLVKETGGPSVKIDRKDLGAGAIFVAFGAYFAISSVAQLRLGTAFRMGPGYFPLFVAGLLTALGLAIIVRGLSRTSSPFGSIAWRGLVLLTLAPALFALTVERLGLAISVMLTVLISAFASRQMGLVTALATAVVLTVFCVLVFSYGLGVPVPILGPWIRT